MHECNLIDISATQMLQQHHYYYSMQCRSLIFTEELIDVCIVPIDEESSGWFQNMYYQQIYIF